MNKSIFGLSLFCLCALTSSSLHAMEKTYESKLNPQGGHWQEIIDHESDDEISIVRKVFIPGPDFIPGRAYSLLEAAAEAGNLAEIIKLGDSDYGFIDQAFIVAAKNGHLEVVQYLIEHGAHINAEMDTAGDVALQGLGTSALTAAAANNQGEIVAFLIEKGAALNTGLFGACPALSVTWDKNIIRMLKDAGAKESLASTYRKKAYRRCCGTLKIDRK